ncbi:TBP-interacting protein tip49 [Parelaphostrongylus tenuis]|uniref:RuvB-like helicase n=1 Tax=Parelaphostrongylus tenuis TaxID=148309 RepID=A0AAD5RC07_PARTN|nr:TBP-interacting protein tip49 [Parelaphostrongylus tenuis]
MGSELSPLLIMVTNKERGVVRGTDVTANCCLTYDLVDRLNGIATKPYTSDEIGKILSLRADEEGVRSQKDAISAAYKMFYDTKEDEIYLTKNSDKFLM